MKNLKITIYASLVFLSAGAAWGLTIDDAVRTAVMQNPELTALRLEEEVAGGQVRKAELPFVANPVIESYTSRKQKLPEEGSGSVTNYGVRLLQEFEVAGQRGIRIEVAQKNLARIGLEIRDRERMLRYDVKNAFAGALALKEKAALMEEVVRLKEELLDLTRTKYQAGEVSALEVNLAEVEASKARSDLIAVERSYGESRLALLGIMGAGVGTLPPIEGQLAPGVTAIPDKESLKQVLEERPDIRAAIVEVERTGRAEALARRETVPNPSLGGFYNRDEQRNEVGVILSVSIPLFDRKQAQRTEARARMEQARIRRAGLGLSVEREFEQEYANLSSSFRQLSVYKTEILAKSLENLDLLNLAFREGKISFFDVRLAQRDAIDLRLAYIDTLLRTRQAVHGMERTIGGNLK